MKDENKCGSRTSQPPVSGNQGLGCEAEKQEFTIAFAEEHVTNIQEKNRNKHEEAEARRKAEQKKSTKVTNTNPDGRPTPRSKQRHQVENLENQIRTEKRKLAKAKGQSKILAYEDEIKRLEVELEKVRNPNMVKGGPSASHIKTELQEAYDQLQEKTNTLYSKGEISAASELQERANELNRLAKQADSDLLKNADELLDQAAKGKRFARLGKFVPMTGWILGAFSIASDVEAYGSVEGTARNFPVLGDCVSIVIDTHRIIQASSDIKKLKDNDIKGARLTRLIKRRNVAREVRKIVADHGQWQFSPPHNSMSHIWNLEPVLEQAIKKLALDIENSYVAGKNKDFVRVQSRYENALKRYRETLKAAGFVEPPKRKIK